MGIKYYVPGITLDIAADAGLIRHWHEQLPEFKPTEDMIRFWRPMAESVD